MGKTHVKMTEYFQVLESEFQNRKSLSTSTFTFTQIKSLWWDILFVYFVLININNVVQANSAAACQRACEIEAEFLCRSYLYLGPPTGAQYNCRLYHLDHWTLPDGPSTFLNNDRPLIDNGGRIGTFYENRCKSKFSFSLSIITLLRPWQSQYHCTRLEQENMFQDRIHLILLSSDTLWLLSLLECLLSSFIHLWMKSELIFISTLRKILSHLSIVSFIWRERWLLNVMVSVVSTRSCSHTFTVTCPHVSTLCSSSPDSGHGKKYFF